MGVAAGTYQVKLSYKAHPNRGILQPSANGSNFGSTLDQYSATITYPEATLGTVTFNTTGNQLLRFTCTGKNTASGAYTLSLDKITLVPVTTTLSWEAENLAYTTNGAVAAMQTDANTSGGSWLGFMADGVNDWIQFTLPNIAAGTYQVQLSYKSHPNRGTLQASANGANFGSTLDQYAATPAYPNATLGTVTFTTSGSQTLRLTVTGKNTASGAYTLSADKVTLVGQ